MDAGPSSFSFFPPPPHSQDFFFSDFPFFTFFGSTIVGKPSCFSFFPPPFIGPFLPIPVGVPFLFFLLFFFKKKTLGLPTLCLRPGISFFFSPVVRRIREKFTLMVFPLFPPFCSLSGMDLFLLSSVRSRQTGCWLLFFLFFFFENCFFPHFFSDGQSRRILVSFPPSWSIAGRQLYFPSPFFSSGQKFFFSFLLENWKLPFFCRRGPARVAKPSCCPGFPPLFPLLLKIEKTKDRSGFFLSLCCLRRECGAFYPLFGPCKLSEPFRPDPGDPSPFTTPR